MQYIVRFSSKQERRRAFMWLKEHGYELSQSLFEKKYPYSDVIIDWKIVFKASISCLAAGRSNGMPLMTWTEWLKEKEEDKLFC